MQIVDKVLELSGFDELNPVQKKALDNGVLDHSMVIAAPTASGKTLSAEMAALNIIKKGKKVIYIVPLKALANEKYDEFKERYESLGMRIAISIGDLDSSDSWLANYDLIIVTSEKLDSMLRHGVQWLNDVGLVIVDEIHLIDSANRGPTLEVVLTRLRQEINPQILALSATISNHKELAEWLSAKPIRSDYRPTTLYKGIYYENKVNFIPKKDDLEFNNTDLTTLINNVLKKDKQSLVFLSTRRSAEAVAEELSRHTKENLEELSENVLNVLDKPTKQCEKLSRCIKKGIAFHHAGLTSKQRKMIENSFREGKLKVITATPTLSFGLNLPADVVVIRDLKRFSSVKGMDFLPILEIHQMMGRSGRPRYHSEGEAILMPKNDAEAHYAWDSYINGTPEDITSKLGVEPVLRVHVLALIASEVIKTKERLFEFFSKTFYGHQYKDLESLKQRIEKVLVMLEGFNFITTGSSEPFKPASMQIDELKATRIGKRVSELYIDPLTANQLIKNLQIAKEKKLTNFSLLHLLSNTIEMRPLLSIKRKDIEDINEFLNRYERDLIIRAPSEFNFEYDDFLRSIKTAWFFDDWCSESTEDALLDKFGVTPGELRARLDIADWLIYATQELALLSNHMDMIKHIRKTRLRLKYGIKEELLPLVKLRGIGRSRARKLFNSNQKNLNDLRRIPQKKLEDIIGIKTAYKIKEQLGDENKQKTL